MSLLHVPSHIKQKYQFNFYVERKLGWKHKNWRMFWIQLLCDFKLVLHATWSQKNHLITGISQIYFILSGTLIYT